MLNEIWFEKIASKEWSRNWFIRESDSDVYKMKDHCYKYYYGLTKDKIIEYHMLQNWLSRNPLIIDLVWDTDLNELDSSIFNSLWVVSSKIDKISFTWLDLWNHITLASDINTKENIVISEIKYIKWENLLDTCMNNGDNIDLLMNIYNIIKKINADFSREIWINLSVSNPIDKFQIHWINCKVTWIKDWTLFITITDIARNIWDIVNNNKLKILSLIK
jgi:hypothetical protein